MPPAVQTAYTELARPEDIDWVGVPVWQTAYITALRALATRRRHDRRNAGNNPGFNAEWAAVHTTESAVGAAALQSIAPETVAPLRRAVRSVLLANTLLTTPPEALPSAAWGVEDARSGLQRYVGESLRWFTVSPPTMSEKTKLDRYPQLPNAFLVVLPTASGKTKVAGDWLARQGVGRPLPDGTSPRVIWVTDQQKLVDDCLNPKKTLRKCLPPGTKFTSVWQGHKKPEDATGDIVVITKDSLTVAIETGLIDPNDFDMAVFDEADIMLGEVRMVTLRKFDNCKKLLLTATPSRNERKDLQKMVHHIRPLSLLEAVENKVIVPVRILTYMARDEAHAESLAAAIALHLFIKDGDKAIAYCQPGGRNAQAARLAKAVRLHAPEVLGWELDETIVIDMVGAVRPDSHAIIEHFDMQADAGLLTTCGMVSRGWDVKRRLKAVIFLGQQGDPIAMIQEMGRTFRYEPDNPDKVATIAQIKYAPEVGRVDYTAEMAFGFDEVMSGVTIGLRPDSESGTTEPSGRVRARPEDRDFLRRLAELPDELQAALAPAGKPLVDLLVAPNDPRYNRYVKPEGYDTSIADLLSRHPGISREWFHVNMGKFTYQDPTTGEEVIGVPYAFIRSILPESGARGERYYDTKGVELFLSQVPVPKVAPAQSFTSRGLGQYLGVPETLVEAVARKLEIVIEEKTLSPDRKSRGRPGRRFTGDEITRITEGINNIPIADDTHVWFAEITAQYGQFATAYCARKGIKSQPLRHPDDSPANGIGYFIDEGDARAIRAEHARLTGVMETHRSINAIAKRVGVNRMTVVRSLTDDERVYLDDPDLTFTPLNARSKPVRHVPNEVADAIEARLAPKLSNTEVPRRALAQTFGISEGRVAQLVGGYGAGRRRLGSYQGASQVVYHIHALASLIDFYKSGRGRGNAELPQAILDIDLDRLPKPGQEPTIPQLAYVDTVRQAILGINPALLGPSPREQAQAARAKCNMDEFAFGLLVNQLDIGPDDVQQQNGTITGLSPHAALLAQGYSIGLPSQGHMRLGLIASRGQSSVEQTIEVIRAIGQERGGLRQDTYSFGRSGTTVELYFARDIAREAIQRLREARFNGRTTFSRLNNH